MHQCKKPVKIIIQNEDSPLKNFNVLSPEESKDDIDMPAIRNLRKNSAQFDSPKERLALLNKKSSSASKRRNCSGTDKNSVSNFLGIESIDQSNQTSS
jgi:hypothetical protein